jgi:hypothetical protein
MVRLWTDTDPFHTRSESEHIVRRDVTASGDMTLARARLLICTALLAVPAFWTGDKLLQIHATSIAKERVLARVQDEEYLSQLFSIPTPFQYADYYVFEANYLTRKESHTRNELTRFLKFTTAIPTKRFRIYLKYTDRLAKIQWFEFPLDGCKDGYCNYDPALLNPTAALDEIDVSAIIHEKNISERILFYDFIETVTLSMYTNGKTISISASISNTGLNPIDDTIRQLEASSGPDYWNTRWTYSESKVSGDIAIEEY